MVTPSESQANRTKTKKQKEGKKYISCFVSYTYYKDSADPVSQERHSEVICPVVRGVDSCTRVGKLRDGGIIHHDCPLLSQPKITTFPIFHPNTRQESLRQLQSSRKSLLYKLMELLITFFAGNPVSFRLLASPNFRNLLLGICQLGRERADLPPEVIIPRLSVHSIPRMLKLRAIDVFNSLLDDLKGSFVSLMMDAATIAHKSYLAITICKTEPNSPLLFFQLINAPSTKEDYTAVVLKTVRFLQSKEIDVASICSDGASAQITGIGQARQTLLSIKDPLEQRPSLIPIHVPCLNHRVNLALIHTITNCPTLTRITDILKSFTHEAVKKANYTLLDKTCPSFIPTRWFSLWNIATYIRLKRNVIISSNLLPPQIVQEILMLEVLLTPFTELTLFFETENVRFAQVFPALLRAFNEFLLIIQHPAFNKGEWLRIIVEAMRNLFNYCLSGTLGYLAALAFSLVPEGRFLKLHNMLLSGYRLDSNLSDSFRYQFVLSSFVTIISKRIGHPLTATLSLLQIQYKSCSRQSNFRGVSLHQSQVVVHQLYMLILP